jgi:hypothetical protein
MKCLSNILVECAGPQGTAVAFALTANDNCDPAPSIICTRHSGELFPLGVTTVVCSATDVAGNSGLCYFTITVLDTTPPAINCPGDLTVECAAPDTPVFYFVTATDACTSDVNVVCVPPSGASFPLGSTQVSCSSADEQGNRNSCSFAVTLTTTAPAPTLSIEAHGTNVLICWGTSCGEYVLEGTTDLKPPMNWSRIGAPLVIVNDRNCVIPSIGNHSRFFRLRRQ